MSLRGQDATSTEGRPCACTRVATTNDLGAVLELWTLSGNVPTITDCLASLELLVTTDPRALLVADAEQVIIGSLIAAWNGWRGSLYRLAVHPHHRRNGLGRAMVREAEERLRQRGARRIDAIVDSDEPAAIAFWSAVGYERQRSRSRFVRNL